jgi:hypothetical protein
LVGFLGVDLGVVLGVDLGVVFGGEGGVASEVLPFFALEVLFLGMGLASVLSRVLGLAGSTARFFFGVVSSAAKLGLFKVATSDSLDRVMAVCERGKSGTVV